MATMTQPTKTGAGASNLVEMAWDPITRIVGSLGIYTKIDFANRRVVECRSTSSIFRGYSVFLRGKDPRDAHLITSRICCIHMLGYMTLLDNYACHKMFFDKLNLVLYMVYCS